MTNTTRSAFLGWVEKGQHLLDETHRRLQAVGVDDSTIPTTFEDGQNRRLKLVFAGQYSSGKSTILKALTGIETIETGIKITTQEPHTYEWNGMDVIDTPGIGSGLRPEHDALSLQAIAEADLLIYVVTSDLFDSQTVQQFHTLLVEGNRAKEMVLVVNQMSRCTNTDEKRAVKAKALEPMTAPYSPEDLHTVYIDAEDYLKGRPQRKHRFETLTQALDTIAKTRDLPARLTTPLQMARKRLGELSDKLAAARDKDGSAIESSRLRQLRNQEQNMLWSIGQEAKRLLSELVEKIDELGSQTALQVQDWTTKEAGKQGLEKANAQLEAISAEYVTTISKTIESRLKQGEVDFKKLYETLFPGVLNEIDPVPGEHKGFSTHRRGHSVGDKAGKLAEEIFIRGGKGHEWIIKIGHMVGHKFKPYEAIKWVSFLNKISAALTFIGPFIDIAIELYNDHLQKQREEALRKARESLRANFDSCADEIRKDLQRKVDGVLLQVFNARIAPIDEHLEEIEQERASADASSREVSLLLGEYTALIRDIQESSLLDTPEA